MGNIHHLWPFEKENMMINHCPLKSLSPSQVTEQIGQLKKESGECREQLGKREQDHTGKRMGGLEVITNHSMGI